MASIRFFLDCRRLKADGSAPLKLAITHMRIVRYVSLDLSVAPSLWDSAACRISAKHPQHLRMNNLLTRWLLSAQDALLSYLSTGMPVSVQALQGAVERAVHPQAETPVVKVDTSTTLVRLMERFAATKKQSTRLTYERTLKHIKSYAEDWERLRLEDVTRSWLIGFDAHMALSAPSPNARAIHMRNLRAVMNFAVDEGLTMNYPFRKFRIKTIKTAKRSLSADDLRRLFNADVDEWQRPYVDFFKLSFCLVGINPVDLLHLSHSDLQDGRIVYNRSKTSRLYSIKVEPEAAALIRGLRGEGHLLRFMDGREDYLQFVRQANHALKSVGTGSRPGRKGTEPAWFPALTMYWARHSWATIARSLGVSVDDIALALGHGDGHDLTHIYIDEDLRKIDEANRRVLDFVCGAVGDTDIWHNSNGNGF